MYLRMCLKVSLFLYGKNKEISVKNRADAPILHTAN